jgi:threonine/homoserine/homoserine lactone efflux protein
VSLSSHIGPAFALGFALGAAPGPVQLLILTETAKRGFSGGVRVMLGANGTLFLVMVALAFGFSSLAPGVGVLRGLRVVGGAFLIYLAIDELRRVRLETGDPDAGDAVPPTMGPTARGVVSVVLNPGAWIFFATTASAVIADATADGGTDTALAAAVAMTIGVSLSDFTFTLVGSGGRRLVGDRGLRWIRSALSIGLAAIGAAFILQGLRST